jgi:hypothetical protein
MIVGAMDLTRPVPTIENSSAHAAGRHQELGPASHPADAGEAVFE